MPAEASGPAPGATGNEAATYAGGGAAGTAASGDAGACEAPHLDQGRADELRDRLLGDRASAALAETFRVLGDVTRVRILDAIAHSELCVCDIARLLNLSESATSHQLRVLRGMRLVRPRRAGRQIFYALDDHHIVRLFAQGLEHVQERNQDVDRLRAL